MFYSDNIKTLNSYFLKNLDFNLFQQKMPHFHEAFLIVFIEKKPKLLKLLELYLLLLEIL